MRKISILTVCAGLLAGASLAAQNFNESVEVTNDLLVDMSGMQRKTVPMEIPDSLYRFNLKFDYSVFDKPYRGAYEFKPYNVLFKPVDKVEPSSMLYFRAGGGFSWDYMKFSPVLDAVVTPKISDRFNMSLYQSMNGYSGYYSALREGTDRYIRGYEYNELVGAQGTAYLKGADLSFDVYYNGKWVKDYTLGGAPYHTLGARLGLVSEEKRVRYMDYDLALDFRSSKDHNYIGGLSENSLSIGGRLRPYIQSRIGATMDFDTGFDLYGGVLSSAMYYMKITPKAAFSLGKFDFALGAGISYYSRLGKNSLYIYPDCEVSIELFKNSLELFAGVGGGDKLNSYHSFKQDNAHYSLSYNADALGVSRQAYDAFVGMRGVIGPFLGYNLRAGYADNRSAVLYTFDSADVMQVRQIYGNYRQSYAGGSLMWKSRSWDVNLGADFNRTDITGKLDAFDLPAWQVGLDVTYNYMGRVYAGTSLKYVSARQSTVYDARRQFVDWGVNAEYRFSGGAGLWLRLTNLLGQYVEYVPFTGHRDFCMLMGVSLDF